MWAIAGPVGTCELNDRKASTGLPRLLPCKRTPKASRDVSE